ncbi:hypothetical protein GCM10025868_31760 [Angustibacter aerolatus]|uniref:Polysaccharide biosynthesis enzyme WcbI domain-containing protein n=1 Tax=Angustibacter aerolatus TaxID=1162965 RepID=A0ABQ6JI56_9ACTN|nr:hypothetical protein GCM10025868_31760 [Angustibacter aerolatus]
MVSDLLTTAGAEAAHTINHPGNQVLIGLARRVQAALGWAPDATDPGRTLLDSVHAPLDPLVVAAHGLDVAPRPDWVVGGRAVPDADVVEAPALVRRAPARGARGAAAARTAAAACSAGGPREHAPPRRRAPEHGVTRCGQAHADADLAAGAASGRTRVERAVDLPDLAWLPDLLQHEAAGHHVHAHVTDRLLGTDPHRAREVLQALAARVPLSVTLHDLPQPADGRWFDARRALAAAAVAGCRRVVVSSEHERRLLAACLPPGTDLSHVHVVPLPLDAHPAGPGRPPHHPVVGALGFVYPGKGHDDVLEALRGVEGAEPAGARPGRCRARRPARRPAPAGRGAGHRAHRHRLRAGRRACRSGCAR